MVHRYSEIITTYYTDYVAGYDKILLAEMADRLIGLTENDHLLIRSFIETVSNIKCK